MRRWEGNIKMNLGSNSMGERGLGYFSSGQVEVLGCYGHGNEPLSNIRCERFLDMLSNC